MENAKSIRLSTSLGLIIAQELKDKYGIDKWQDGSIITFRFTKEELSKIRELKLINPNKGALDGIEHLSELRTLSIEGTGFNEFIHPDKRKSIDDNDIMHIEKCSSLKNLTVINQPNVTDIDLSKLSNLEDLNISNNMNLEAIDGIDKLSKLFSFTCYGNKSLQNFNGLDQAIVNNKENLSELNLDVLLFPKAIGYKPFNGSYNQNAVDALDYINGTKVGLNNVKWCENISNFAATKIVHPNMLSMHNKACQILDNICPRNESVKDTVVAVERYLAENVTYDYESLEHGYAKGDKIETDGQGIRLITGIKYGTNSAFDCIMKQSCICEGYTRGEQYLLGLKGIRTHNVGCVAREDTMGMSDHTKKDDWTTEYKLPKGEFHSIIRIDDYYDLYSDPCWNACSYQQGKKTLPYTLLTKAEMSKDHMLSFEERSVMYHAQSATRGQIAESLRTNTLFRNSRTSEVNNQRTALQQDARGIVRGADGRAY